MMKIQRCLVALSISLIAPFSLAQQMLPLEVQELMGKAAAAYRELKAFSGILETTQQMGPAMRTGKTTFTFVKPAKVMAEVVQGEVITRVVSDGTKAYNDSSLSKGTYTEQAVENNPDGVMPAMDRAGALGSGLLAILLTSPESVDRLIPSAGSTVTRQPDETLDGVPCDVIIAEMGQAGQGRRITFAIGKQDHLIRRVTLGQLAQPTPVVVETFTKVTTSPQVNDDLFKYTPAPGAVAVAAPKEPEMFDSRVKVGADPLTIAGKDLEGKDVSLDQYKGKVLLVDFWAIWCGPCVAELPNVVQAYQKYHGQGFEVLGISLDEAEAKAKLVAFTGENKMPWRQIYDGGQWNAANAVAWGVKAIPFTVLIGKDGKIAGVNLRGEALGPAIEAALKK